MLNLKNYRSKEAGLPDLLSYAALIDDGIVLGKDGSLMAGFFIRGDDPMASTDAERDYVTAQVNNCLARFGSGWAIWVAAIRLESPTYPEPELSHFPDAISALIDEERRQHFKTIGAHYETEYALIIQYIPPTRKSSKLGEMVYNDDTVDTTSPADRILSEFKKKLEDFYVAIGDLLKMQRMKAITITLPNGESYESDQLINYLHYSVNGELIALRIPDCPMYLDSWLGFKDLWPGDTPLLGDNYIACVSIDGFPAASYPGILDVLDGLPVPYRWSSRFIFLDQHEAISDINRFRLKWQQKIRGFWTQIFKTNSGNINTDALMMSQQAEVAMNEARSGIVAFGYYTSTIVLMHKDREFITEQARNIKREVERKGFSARIETINTMEAWLGSLPGQVYPNIRRPLINTLNLSDMLPLSSVWPGLQNNPCPFYPDNSPALAQTVTTGATPFRLNLHVDDVGHTLIFGPTGAGKSTLLAFLLAQARRYWSKATYEDGKHLPANITAFDKGNSLFTLCNAVGGSHYDIGSDDFANAFMPLAEIDSTTDNVWAQEWISTCFELRTNKPLTPGQKSEVHRAMNSLKLSPKHMRTLSNFVTTLQDTELREALRHYTISGQMGHLLDGDIPANDENNFIVYEIDELMKLGEKNGLPVLLYLFRRFERKLRGQPSILSLDEAWIMLSHHTFREKIREWLKELRKKNCLVIIATQSLSDAVRSGIFDVLLEQCPTKILLPNEEAENAGADGVPGASDLYTMMGLNSNEIQIIKNAKKKRQYYYKSINGRRLFELGLGQLSLAFVAVSDKEELAQVNELIANYGEDWPLKWLQLKGIDYEKYTKKS